MPFMLGEHLSTIGKWVDKTFSNRMPKTEAQTQELVI
jgi:hypothetical protein